MSFEHFIAAIRTDLAQSMRATPRDQREAFATWACLTYCGIFIPAQPPETPDAPAPPDARRTPAQITLLGISAEDFDTATALNQWAKAALRSAQQEQAA